MAEIESLDVNIKIICLDKPPIPFEIAEMSNNIIVLKHFIHGSDLPIGSQLCSVNNEDISTKPLSDTMKFLKHWNDSTHDMLTVASGLELKFRINPDYVPAEDLSCQLEQATHIGVDDVINNIHSEHKTDDMLDKINSQLSTKLPTAFIGLYCIIYGWDTEQSIAKLQHLIGEYDELMTLITSLEARRDLLTDSETEDADLISLKYAMREAGDSTNAEYTVSLTSRQLGMTIENVMERTVVRAIHANSDASRLGVKTNSVILKIGSQSTVPLTHLETLEALKNSVRPVKLSFRKVDEKNLAQYRLMMQGLVQRKKTANNESAMTVLDTIENKLLWVLEMSALVEAIAATSEPTHPSINSDDVCSTDSSTNDALDRSLKILSLLQSVKKIFAENVRREALVLMRANSISEILSCMIGLYNWERVADNVDSKGDSVGDVVTDSNASTSQESIFSSSLSPISFIGPTLRDVCYMLLQLQNDQQVDMQLECRPDPSTYSILENLVGYTLTSDVIQSSHIPNLWKLGISSNIPARIACADLVPVIYTKLSEIQKLRIRGLVNRLLVDSVSIVRAHVMSSVCSRILRIIVTSPEASDRKTAFSDMHAATLNWISHCVVQTSADVDMEVRRASLEACGHLIEYYALGNYDDEQKTTEANQSDNNDSSDNGGMVDRSSEYGNFLQSSNVIVPPTGETHLMFCRMVPIVSRLVEDVDPQIRSTVVAMCGDLCVWMGGKWSAVLLDILLSNFRDPVPEVRAAAITAVPHSIKALMKAATKGADHHRRDHTISELFSSLIPSVASMHTDSSHFVRQALTTTLSNILQIIYNVLVNNQLSSFANLPTLQDKMCEVVLILLDDTTLTVSRNMLKEISLSIEAEINGGGDEKFRELSWTAALFTQENASRLIRSFEILTKSGSWRARYSLCYVIPKLVSISNTVETRMKISNTAVPLLSDGVFEVRKAAARALCLASISDREVAKMVKSHSVTYEGEPVQDIGRMWLDCVVLPQLETLRTSKNFSNRIMALHMIAVLLVEDIVTSDDVRYNILVGIALTLATDKIPNVRLSLCVMLGKIVTYITRLSQIPNNDDSKTSSANDYHANAQSLIYKNVESVLNTLANDKDRDVKHYAQAAVMSLNQNISLLAVSLESTTI